MCGVCMTCMIRQMPSGGGQAGGETPGSRSSVHSSTAPPAPEQSCYTRDSNLFVSRACCTALPARVVSQRPRPPHHCIRSPFRLGVCGVETSEDTPNSSRIGSRCLLFELCSPRRQLHSDGGIRWAVSEPMQSSILLRWRRRGVRALRGARGVCSTKREPSRSSLQSVGAAVRDGLQVMEGGVHLEKRGEEGFHARGRGNITLIFPLPKAPAL